MTAEGLPKRVHLTLYDLGQNFDSFDRSFKFNLDDFVDGCVLDSYAFSVDEHPHRVDTFQIHDEIRRQMELYLAELAEFGVI